MDTIGCPVGRRHLEVLPGFPGLGLARRWAEARPKPGVPNHPPFIFILPELMCLSQRLSHACISVSVLNLKPRAALYNSYNLLDLDQVRGHSARPLRGPGQSTGPFLVQASRPEPPWSMPVGPTPSCPGLSDRPPVVQASRPDLLVSLRTVSIRNLFRFGFFCCLFVFFFLLCDSCRHYLKLCVYISGSAVGH